MGELIKLEVAEGEARAPMSCLVTSISRSLLKAITGLSGGASRRVEGRIRGSDPPLTGYYSTVAVVVEEEVIVVLLRRNRDKPNYFIEKTSYRRTSAMTRRLAAPCHREKRRLCAKK